MIASIVAVSLRDEAATLSEPLSAGVEVSSEGDDDLLSDELTLPLIVKLSGGIGVGGFTSRHCAAAFPRTPPLVVFQLLGMGRSNRFC